MLVVKNSPTNVGEIRDVGLIPGFDPWVWKIPWRRHDNSLQYFCLENLMCGGAWWATVHGVPKSQNDSTHICYKCVCVNSKFLISHSYLLTRGSCRGQGTLLAHHEGNTVSHSFPAPSWPWHSSLQTQRCSGSRNVIPMQPTKYWYLLYCLILG